MVWWGVGSHYKHFFFFNLNGDVYRVVGDGAGAGWTLTILLNVVEKRGIGGGKNLHENNTKNTFLLLYFFFIIFNLVADFLFFFLAKMRCKLHFHINCRAKCVD